MVSEDGGEERSPDRNGRFPCSPWKGHSGTDALQSMKNLTPQHEDNS